jgi:hypothetical protein
MESKMLGFVTHAQVLLLLERVSEAQRLATMQMKEADGGEWQCRVLQTGPLDGAHLHHFVHQSPCTE